RCLSVTGFTNPPIGKALAACASEQIVGALGVFNAKRRAAVISEIKFREVAVQVSLAAMLVGAEHAALEHREHVFDGVGVDGLITFVADVFTSRVIDGAVLVELFAKLGVEAAIVGVERALAVCISEQDFAHAVLGGALDVEAADVAAALDEGHNGTLDVAGFALQVGASLTLGRRALIILATDVGLVGFHGLAFAADRALRGNGL